ncbi:hypothetical protein [Vibrio nereis]|uniref:hypothetical protein n=1 Tax=Vibrio nereis TaxID=693 RepID=UPI0024941F59|nr:hypothetical protein [Vibrio nereis]
MNNHILFTGLIRDESLFLSKLELSLKLKSEGLIGSVIFSTWIGEVNKYPKVHSFIKRNSIVLVENQEPNIKTTGYIMHQMKSLYFGMKFIPEKDFLYKMRPDLGSFNIDLVRDILKNKSRLLINANQENIFRSKVVIDGGFLTHPFYMNDIQFFGAREDIQKMVNFDMKYEVVYNDVSPEQYFYIAPFIEKFDIFKTFFSMNQGLMHGDEIREKKYLDFFFNSDLHIDVLSNYIYILSEYFIINGNNSIYDNKNLSWQELFLNDDKDFSTYPSLSHSPSFKGMAWIEYIKNYQGTDPVINKISKKIKLLKKGGDREKTYSDLVKLEDYHATLCFLEKEMKNNRFKVAQEIDCNHYRYKGGFIRVTVPNAEDQTISHLENQLNEAKRKYESVCLELERTKSGK